MERITSFFVARNLVDEKYAAWCVYALQRIGLFAFTFGVLLLLGGVLSSIPETFCLLAAFWWLRRRTGGNHAKTPVRCMVLSLTMVIGSTVILDPLLARSGTLATLVITASAVLLVLFVLLRGYSKMHLSPQDLLGNHKCAVRIVLLEAACTALLLQWFPQTRLASFFRQEWQSMTFQVHHTQYSTRKMRKISNLKQMLMERAGKALEELTVKEIHGWPPACMGPYYQPERPQRVEVTEREKADK